MGPVVNVDSLVQQQQALGRASQTLAGVGDILARCEDYMTCSRYSKNGKSKLRVTGRRRRPDFLTVMYTFNR